MAECKGHESTSGAIGSTVYCDGSCQMVQCDKCGKPNDRARESNYCTQCRAEYQKRLDGDKEYRPYDVK